MHKCGEPEYTRVIRKSVFDILTIVVLQEQPAVTGLADFMERYKNCDVFKIKDFIIRDSRESGYGKNRIFHSDRFDRR